MQTIQLQCGQCKQVMAILAEHLGQQVQCPHCQTVVQTPPVTPPAPAAPRPAPVPEPVRAGTTTMQAPPDEPQDSIFSSPVSEDALGLEPEPPKIEMPAPLPSIPPPPVGATPLQQLGALDGSVETTMPRMPESLPDRPLGPATRGMPQAKGNFSAILLIFLVPYAILSTLFIIYLLWDISKRPHPLDYLPDPAQKSGKVSQKYRNDLPLASHQITRMGRPLRVGALEVKPLKVMKTENNGLALHLHVKNLTPERLSPLDSSFFRGELEGGKGYTFLTTTPEASLKHRAFGVIYNFYDKAGHEEPGGDVMGQGDERILVLRTLDRDAVEHVPALLKTKNDLLWRIHLRRGTEEYRGKRLAISAVIAVQIRPDDLVGSN